jgi:mRNA deadenylase 3'-5' endonuclease subunit Ccr4
MRFRTLGRTAAIFCLDIRYRLTKVQAAATKADITTLVSISLASVTLSFPIFFRQAPSLLAHPRSMSKIPSGKPHRPKLFRHGNDCKVEVNDDDDRYNGAENDDDDISRIQNSHYYTIPNCGLDDSLDNYSLVMDNFGHAAFETSIRPSEREIKELCSSNATSFVRVEAEPCKDISSLKSVKDVWNEIQKAKSYQSQFGHKTDIYPRFWEETSDCHSRSGGNSTYQFTAMQFNTLAEGLSAGPHVRTPFNVTSLNSSIAKKNGVNKPQFYGGFDKVPHPEVVLDFSFRRWRLIEIVLSLSKDTDGNSNSDGPDILAMEEVDRYYGFFQPILAKMGYEGTFAPKPNAPGVSLGWYSDGCALFWKHEIFENISCCKRSYGAGTQVYLIAVLRHRSTGRDIVVAVTHLKAQDSEACEKIRYLQAIELVKEVTSVAQTLHVRPENKVIGKIHQGASSSSTTYAKVPIILLGDFNAEPYGECRECISSIVGDVEEHSINDKDERIAITDDLSLSECCFFQTAYAHGAGSYTTWKTRNGKTVKRVIDYIFHNSQPPSGIKHPDDPSPSTGKSANCEGPPGMRCTHTLSIPQPKDLESTFLPGFRQPSDHFMIAAKFEIDDL